MEFNKLSSSIYEAIFSQLDFLSIMAILKVFPELKTYALPYINSTYVVKRMCNKLGLRYEDLLSRMTPLNPDSGSILFGGMVTNFILGEIIPIDSDADFDIIHYIYQNDTYYPLESDLEIMNGDNNTQHSIYPLIHQSNAPMDDDEGFYYPTYFIKKDGTASDNRIYDHNTLGYATKSLDEYIMDMCDLSVAQVYYDPRKPDFFIKNLDEFLYRKFTVNVNNLLYKEFIKYKKLYPDYQKYMKNFIYNTSYDNHIIERVKKYQRKGFHIEIEDKYNSYNIIDAYGLLGTDPYFFKDIFKKIDTENKKNSDSYDDSILNSTPIFFNNIWKITNTVQIYYKKYIEKFRLRPSKCTMISIVDNKKQTSSEMLNKNKKLRIPIFNADHIYIPHYHIKKYFSTLKNHTIQKTIYYQDYLSCKYHLINSNYIDYNTGLYYTELHNEHSYLRILCYNHSDFQRAADIKKCLPQPFYDFIYVLNYITLSKFSWNG